MKLRPLNKQLHIENIKSPFNMKTNGYLGNITTIVLAPVVQIVDNAIQWISVDQAYYANHWIVIYQVDSLFTLSTSGAWSKCFLHCLSLGIKLLYIIMVFLINKTTSNILQTGYGKFLRTKKLLGK